MFIKFVTFLLLLLERERGPHDVASSLFSVAIAFYLTEVSRCSSSSASLFLGFLSDFVSPFFNNLKRGFTMGRTSGNCRDSVLFCASIKGLKMALTW